MESFLYGLQGLRGLRYALRVNPEGLWSLFSTDFGDFATRFGSILRVYGLFSLRTLGTYWTRYAHRANPEGLWILFSTDFRDFGDFATRIGLILRVYGVFSLRTSGTSLRDSGQS